MLCFSKRAYWWILFPQICIDSGSSTTLRPSSAAVLETTYAVKRGSDVARMKMASYFGISETFSLNMKLNSWPSFSAVRLKLLRAFSSLGSEKLYFSTKQAILANYLFTHAQHLRNFFRNRFQVG